MTQFIELLPRTNFHEPTPAQVEKLHAIIVAAEPWIADKVWIDEFRRAFRALGYVWRTLKPRSDVYFSAHVESVNAVLALWGAHEVDGNAVYAVFALMPMFRTVWRTGRAVN